MAQLITWIQSSWLGEMQPGEVHGWVAQGGLQPSDVIQIMAHPIVGNPNAPERMLRVENVRTDGLPDGTRKILYEVRNVGLTPIPAYVKTYMMLRP